MAGNATNHYDVLGLAKDASAADIKSAYRKLAKEHHPDKNAGDTASEAKFKEVNEAYQVLSDPAKRREYDARQASPNPGQGRQQQQYRDPWEHIHNMYRQVVQDTYFTFQLSMAQVYSGEEPEIVYERLTRCPKCGGKGGPNCTCDGGAVRERTSVKLAGVAHVRSQHTYQFTDKGNYNAAAGQFGDLIIQVEVVPTPGFRAVGYDLYTSIVVHFQDAIDGNKVNYTHIDGKQYKVQLPPLTDRHQQVRLPNMGFVGHDEKRGALVATVEITIDYSRLTATDLVKADVYKEDTTTEQDGTAAH
jgi:molecular chaperone DnaJ